MHKHGARKRWKQAINAHIQQVPGSVVKSFNTLTYRLRGEGYEYDQETDFWFFIEDKEERLGKIAEYQAERAEARRIQDEEIRRREDEARIAARKGKIKTIVIPAQIEPHLP